MSNKHTNITGNNTIHYDASLKYITHAKYGNDWKSLKHFHQYTEIFFVMNGTGTFTVENKTFPIHKNDIIIVNPHIYHHEDSSIEGALEYIALGIDGFTMTYDQQYVPYIHQNFDRYRHELELCLNQLLQESQNKEYGYENICQNFLKIIILKIMRHIHNSIYNSNTKSLPFNREVSRIKEYIDTNYFENITLDSLANQTNLNKFYISHLFKDALGISPINYLNSKRLSVCKTLLKTSSLSISEISETVGFSSQSYFTQTFKKFTNMTPNQYRRLHQTK